MRQAVITHCGKKIVEGDRPVLEAELRAMASERGIQARFAHDGLEIILR